MGRFFLFSLFSSQNDKTISRWTVIYVTQPEVSWKYMPFQLLVLLSRQINHFLTQELPHYETGRFCWARHVTTRFPWQGKTRAENKFLNGEACPISDIEQHLDFVWWKFTILHRCTLSGPCYFSTTNKWEEKNKKYEFWAVCGSKKFYSLYR